MKNKILSLLMVATMAVGMLAGCGSKTNAPADNQVKEECGIDNHLILHN